LNCNLNNMDFKSLLNTFPTYGHSDFRDPNNQFVDPYVILFM
jgi:hypothetical protein